MAVTTVYLLYVLLNVIYIGDRQMGVESMIQRKNVYNFYLLLLPIIYIFVYKFFLLDNVLKYAEFISASVMIALVFLAVLLLGFRQNKENILKKNVKSFVITFTVLYFSITYGLGLFLGFLKNSYSLALHTLIGNVFCPMIVIVCLELFRYIIISANKDRKYVVVLATIVITLLDLFLNVKLSSFNSFSVFFETFTVSILPLFAKNILLSYLTYWVGYQTTLIYHLIMGLYIFVMPIFPDLGNFISSSIGILFPFLIYYFASRMISEYENGVEHVFVNDAFGLVDIIGLGIIAVIVGLTSDKLPLNILGIVSESMAPTIERGDAVIVKKIRSIDDLKGGEVIAFNSNGKEIVHRFIEVRDDNGKICYVTKGDANANSDYGCLEFEDINGVVVLKLPGIAYPRIVISELLKGEKE